MNNPQASMDQFELDFNNALAMLAERHPEDGAIDALLFAEEARPNLGSDSYAPEWIQPLRGGGRQPRPGPLHAHGGEHRRSGLGHSPGDRSCVGKGCTIGLHRRVPGGQR